jgi:hypothetical protein
LESLGHTKLSSAASLDEVTLLLVEVVGVVGVISEREPGDNSENDGRNT